MSHSDKDAAAKAGDKARADRDRLSDDWAEASGKTEKSWGDRPAEPPAQKPSSTEKLMDRTEESYGTGKNNADPQADHSGETPDDPVV